MTETSNIKKYFEGVPQGNISELFKFFFTQFLGHEYLVPFLLMKHYAKAPKLLGWLLLQKLGNMATSVVLFSF